MGTTQPIRRLEDVQKLKNYFLQKNEIRNYAMVTIGLNTALRISDILESCYRTRKKDTKIQYVCTKQKCDRSLRYAKKFSYLYNTRLLYCEK